jgi:phytol kinase
MSPEVQGVLILLGLFGGLVGGVETWTRLANPRPEISRKAVHVGAGAICLLFPVLLSSAWVVLALAVVFTVFFAMGQKLGVLQCVGRIKRSSRGSEYYPIAIFLLFVLCGNETWRFVASVLVLAIADAGAALVGTRYGRIRYKVEDAEKTLEGSLAFLALAVLVILLPAVFLSELPLSIVIGSALLVALVVTGLEAISLRGADNLFVPIAAATILGKISTKPLAEVVYQNLSFIVLIMGGSLIIWRTGYLNTAAGVALIWMIYGAWSLGGESWAIPIIISFVCYVIVRFTVGGKMQNEEAVVMRQVFRMVLVPLLILVVGNALQRGPAFYPMYLSAGSVTLALIIWRRVEVLRPSWVSYIAVSLSGCLAVSAPLWWLVARPVHLVGTILAISLIVLSALRVVRPRSSESEFETRVVISALGAALLALVLS